MLVAEPTLLIRADASKNIGTGHIMRMVALGQAWRDSGGKSVFLCAEITPALGKRLKEEGFSCERLDASPGSDEDIELTCSAISRHGNCSALVVLDGYQFGSGFQAKLKRRGCHLLVMDDYGHADAHHADWVLNQNISASENLYQTNADHARLLLGTKFALLRSEFLKFRGWSRKIPKVARNILVTLGGADPANVTARIVQSLATLDFQVRVIVGGSNPHLESIRHAVEAFGNERARFELLVDSNNMPELMAWADLAIAAGGSTAWELAFMGLPGIFFVLADNQQAIAVALEQKGLGICLGWPSDDLSFSRLTLAVSQLANDQTKRQILSAQGRFVVDGLGSQRLVGILKDAI